MRSAPLRPLATAIAVVMLCGAAPPPGAESCLRGPFHGITVTDETGVVIGRPDAGDWGCLGGGAPLAPTGVPVPPPTAICLLPASPNPLTVATRLTLTLPAPTHVSLTVWNRSTGHGPPRVDRVKTLMDGDFPAGTHQVIWNGADEQGVRLPVGIYRVLLQAGGGVLCGDVEIR